VLKGSPGKLDGALLGAIGLLTLTSAALAQDDRDAISELTVVSIEAVGDAPTGPYSIVIEHDPGLATHTIYRPQRLDAGKHSVLVWGEGGCANNGLMFPEYLSEIASHGFVVVADGPPGTLGAGAGGPNGPAARGAGGPAQGGRPDPRTMVNGADLVAAIDWLEAEAEDPDSRFYGKVDVGRVAAMGMSCGGLMSYGASADPRVATVGIWNSGLFPDDGNAALYGAINGSVIIVTGGESDIAYENGKRDFEEMPASIPVFYGVYPSVGHGGTYNEDNGGPYGIAAVAWLNWQLRGETGASGRGYFVGDNCAICADPDWVVDSRSLP
jgi:dienelactone hydrolase